MLFHNFGGSLIRPCAVARLCVLDLTIGNGGECHCSEGHGNEGDHGRPGKFENRDMSITMEYSITSVDMMAYFECPKLCERGTLQTRYQEPYQADANLLGHVESHKPLEGIVDVLGRPPRETSSPSCGDRSRVSRNLHLLVTDRRVNSIVGSHMSGVPKRFLPCPCTGPWCSYRKKVGAPNSGLWR